MKKGKEDKPMKKAVVDKITNAEIAKLEAAIQAAENGEPEPEIDTKSIDDTESEPDNISDDIGNTEPKPAFVQAKALFQCVTAHSPSGELGKVVFEHFFIPVQGKDRGRMFDLRSPEDREVLQKINAIREQLFPNIPYQTERNLREFNGGSVVIVVADNGDNPAWEQMKLGNFDSAKWWPSRNRFTPVVRKPRETARWQRAEKPFNAPRVRGEEVVK
jgi:hypothetical protein